MNSLAIKISDRAVLSVELFSTDLNPSEYPLRAVALVLGRAPLPDPSSNSDP